MKLSVNPHKITVIGENSFVQLSEDSSDVITHRVSHWRVLWTPVGAGHVIFIDSPLVGGIKGLADNTEVARYLQKEIEAYLYSSFADPNISFANAKFDRNGTPPSTAEETVTSGEMSITLTWSDFLEPFNFGTDPGFGDRPSGVQTTFFPAQSAILKINDKQANGKPLTTKRGDRDSTSACLAWCETWFKS